MKKNSMMFAGGFAACFAAYVLMGSAPATPTTAKIGVVNFKTCLEGSKFGKQEQGRFDEIKKQMESTIETKEKELNELSPKFKDEYMDQLTPEAEAELKNKFKNLSQDLSQAQNQYYQLLNQANYQIISKMSDWIGTASTKVAKAKGFDIVLNEEACFYRAQSYDMSASVIKELDVLFVEEEKKAKK
ncbi:MAG: hypothetical protein JWO53_841 [Chlamydiia bacterium]|nr:hypothetical protein [Chlamydiia bacterium]